MDTDKHGLAGIIILNLKGDSPQRALRKVEINQGHKLLFAALLCALVKWKQYDILAYELITWEQREKIKLILFLTMNLFFVLLTRKISKFC